MANDVTSQGDDAFVRASNELYNLTTNSCKKCYVRGMSSLAYDGIDSAANIVRKWSVWRSSVEHDGCHGAKKILEALRRRAPSCSHYSDYRDEQNWSGAQECAERLISNECCVCCLAAATNAAACRPFSFEDWIRDRRVRERIDDIVTKLKYRNAENFAMDRVPQTPPPPLAKGEYPPGGWSSASDDDHYTSFDDDDDDEEDEKKENKNCMCARCARERRRRNRARKRRMRRRIAHTRSSRDVSDSSDDDNDGE